tara:strand:- start:1748 stop:2476 length:729 start_codon:yes stop_codon:yes gene_type:complete
MVEYSLDNIVREHIIESLEGNMGYYPKVLQMMKVGLRECNYRITPFYKTVEVQLDATDSFIVPEDYIAYTKIYTIDGNQRKADLGRLDTMYQRPNNAGRKQPSASKGVNQNLPVRNAGDNGVYTGINYGRAYGLTNQEFNPYGYYKEMEGYIAFSSIGDRCVLVDYMSNEHEVGENTMIHPFIVETLKSFCLFKMAKEPGTRQFFKKEYRNEANRSKILFNSFTISELKQAVRHAYSQTPKR